MSEIVLRLDAEVTECGDEVSGAVTAPAASSGDLRVALCRRAEGADVVDDDRSELRLRPETRRPEGDLRFSIDVADAGPISYQGRLTSVRWWIEVSHDGAVVASAPITVLPSGGMAVWAQAAAGPPSR